MKNKILLLISTFLLSFLSANAQTTWYVNDNDPTGDVFTTAIGDDANDGTSTAPFATISKAISVASDGDIIMVDAGTYSDSPITTNKSLEIIGVNNGKDGADPTRGAESTLLDTKITLNGGNGKTIIFDGFKVLANEITGNVISMQGSGEVTVKNNLFERNASSSGTTSRGIVTSGVGQKTIQNNLFTGNQTDYLESSLHTTWAGGIYVNAGGGSKVNVFDNTFNYIRTGLNIDDFQDDIVLIGNKFQNIVLGFAIGGNTVPSGSHTLGSNDFLVNGTAKHIMLYKVNQDFRLDVSSSTFSGMLPSTMTDAQLFAVEAGMVHKGSWPSGTYFEGMVIFKPGHSYAIHPSNSIDQQASVKLQGSINYASDGWTVHVDEGIFTEDITVNKAIILKGANAGTAAGNFPIDSRGAETILDGGFYITKAATIDGFSVTNGAILGGVPAKNLVYIASDNVTVTNSILDHASGTNENGIEVGYYNNFTLSYSTVSNNWRGIYFNPGSGHTLTGNLIDSNNGVGVGIGSDGLSNFTMMGNTISNHNLEGWGASSVGAGVDAHDNIFSNNGTSVAHYGGNPINAGCNYWGQSTGPDANSTFGNVGSSPFLVDNTDDQSGVAGFQPTAGSCQCPDGSVTRLSDNAVFCSIQAAIDDAGTANGETLMVSDGTFTENVTVNKSVTIQGTQVGNDARIRSGNESVLEGYFEISANDVTIDGFTIDFSGNYQGVIRMTSKSNVTIQNNILKQNGWAVGVKAANSNNVIISQNVFNSIQGHTGVLFSNNPFKNINISDNNFIGGNIASTNINFIGAPSYERPAVSNENITISGNTSSTTSGNFIASAFVDDLTITNNSVTGSSSPQIALLGGNRSVGVSNNDLSGNGIGVYVYQYTDSGHPTWPSWPENEGVVINNNALTSNVGVSVANDAHDGTIDANCNWWGQATGANSGQLSGDINVGLYLNSGNNNAGSNAGFIPDANSCIGSVHNVTQDTYFATIQAAIDDALTQAGDIIEAADGTYNERVTIDKSLTLSGQSQAGVILDGTGLSGTGSGIKINNGVKNVKIETLTIQNYTGSTPNGSAGIYAASGNDGFVANQVTVKDNVNASGIYANGPIDGFDVTNSMVSGHGPGARGIVIWNGFKQNINISNNTVNNNNCCGIELQDGSASGVKINNNTIFGNGDNGIGIIGLTSGAGANEVKGNVLDDNGRFGIEIKNPLGTGLDSGDGSIVVEGNYVTLSPGYVNGSSEQRDRAGISVYRRAPDYAAGNPDIPQGVIIRDNEVTGYKQLSASDGFGIVAEGMGHVVEGNTLRRNDVGLQFQMGHTPYTGVGGVGDEGDQSNLNDLYFGRGNSPESCGLEDAGQSYGASANANGVNFRTVGFGDDTNAAYLATNARKVENTDTSVFYCSIQAAVDDSNDNENIKVYPAIYNESVDVWVDGLTIYASENQGIDPTDTGSTRGAESIITPTEGYGMFISAKNITIEGFTFDGMDQADYGVYDYKEDGTGGLILQNNILKHYSIFGFLGYVPNSTSSSDNLVSRNLVELIGGRGIVALWNYYANITDNVIRNTAVGIYAENANKPSDSSIIEWKNNEISASRAGIWYNLVYGTATPVDIEDNVISYEEDSSITRWDGFWITSIGSDINPVIKNNTITGPSSAVSKTVSGYNLWNNNTTATDGIHIEGGSVTNVDYGFWINNWDGYPTTGGSNAKSTRAKIDNVEINNAALAGVYIKDNPQNTNSETNFVFAEILGTTMTGSANGVLVEGEFASANIHDNTSNGFATGVNVDGGSAAIEMNDLKDGTIGISVSNEGKLTSVQNNNLSGNDDAVIIGSGADVPNGIHENDLSGFTNKGVTNNSSVTIDAGCNWWGSNDYDNYIVNAYTGDVDARLYLDDDSHSNSAPGFVPEGTCMGPVHNLYKDTYYSTIQEAIDDASDDHVDEIEVVAGTFNESINIHKSIELKGANADASCSDTRSGESIIIGLGGENNSTVKISADEVTVNGFTIKNPSGNFGVAMSGRSDITINYNIIADVGNATNGVLASTGINFEGNVDATNVNFDNNCISEIRGGQNGCPNTTNGSASGIGITSSVSAGVLTGLSISDNIITDISACDFNGTGGKGAYGILLNIGANGSGNIDGAVISDNVIENLNARWAHGIGLEGNTPNAQVIGNKIKDLTAAGIDAIALFVEDNASVDSVEAHNNSFTGTMAYTVAVNPSSTGILDATCNWHGSNTYADVNAVVAGKVIFTNYLMSDDLDNPVCGGGHTQPTNLQITYTDSNEDILVQFNTEDGDMVANPIPGLDPINDAAAIAGLYQDLYTAIVSNDATAIQNAALTIGDDVITEYYYYDSSNNKVYLQTGGANPLVKNKYWQEYLVDSGNNRHPDWVNGDSDIFVDTYQTHTNPLTGSVNNGWLNDVLGRDLYVTVTTIQNGHVEQITESISIGSGPIKNERTGFGYPTIQLAIDSDDTINGDTILVEAGTYAEDVIVTKEVTIKGPNADIDPCSGTRNDEAVIVPATSAFDSGEIFHVAASNVTITGFTIDGNNPNLTSGVENVTGEDMDAAEGITVYEDNVNNLTVTNNIVKNLTYSGVTLFGTSYSAPATSGHIISNNEFKDLGTYDPTNTMDGWGIGVLLYNSQYTHVFENCMSNVRIGVQTGNFQKPNPGLADFQLIEDNNIQARATGIFYNLQNYSPYTVRNNNITALYNSNEDAASYFRGWRGLLLSSLGNNMGESLIENNNIDGQIDSNETWSKEADGVNIWNVDANAPVRVSGGTIINVDNGVFANNFEGYTENADKGAHGTITGVDISNVNIGIKVYDSPSSTTHNEVNLEIVNNNIDGDNTGSTGVWVSGTNASANIHDNTSTGFTTGVSIEEGSAGINMNDIVENGTGISIGENGKIINDLKNNKIKDNTGDGILIAANAGAVPGVHQNDISGNVGYGINNLSAQTINAICNWWGSTDYENVILPYLNGSVTADFFLANNNQSNTGVGFVPTADCIQALGPDMTPSINLPTATFVQGESRNSVLRITEINNSGNTSQIKIRITILNSYRFEAFDPAMTSITLSNGQIVNVNNSDWIETTPVNSPLSEKTYMSKPGVVLNGSESLIGISVTNVNTSSKATGFYSITVIEDPTGSYDTRTSNNFYTRILTSN